MRLPHISPISPPHLPISPPYLPQISPASSWRRRAPPPYLPHISPYLPHISPISPRFLVEEARAWLGLGSELGVKVRVRVSEP